MFLSIGSRCVMTVESLLAWEHHSNVALRVYCVIQLMCIQLLFIRLVHVYVPLLSSNLLFVFILILVLQQFIFNCSAFVHPTCVYCTVWQIKVKTQSRSLGLHSRLRCLASRRSRHRPWRPWRPHRIFEFCIFRFHLAYELQVVSNHGVNSKNQTERI